MPSHYQVPAKAFALVTVQKAGAKGLNKNLHNSRVRQRLLRNFGIPPKFKSVLKFVPQNDSNEIPGENHVLLKNFSGARVNAGSTDVRPRVKSARARKSKRR